MSESLEIGPVKHRDQEAAMSDPCHYYWVELTVISWILYCKWHAGVSVMAAASEFFCGSACSFSLDKLGYSLCYSSASVPKELIATEKSLGSKWRAAFERPENCSCYYG